MPDGSLIAAVAWVLAAEFINGWADVPDATGTIVSNRVLPPSQAVFMAAVLNRTVINFALGILW